MTKNEWLSIGYEKNLIDSDMYEEITFQEAYREWIVMKIKLLKCQSVDRIECTYYRYFDSDPFALKLVSQISDDVILEYLFILLSKHPNTSYKEFGRIMQIMTGVLNYMHDIHRGGAILHDWHKIKRLVNVDRLSTKHDFEYAIPAQDISILMDKVINDNIYPLKRNACLVLCMNFFLGLRIGELAALTFNDFDFDRNIVTINKTESKFYERDEDGSRLGTMVYKVVDNCKTVYSVRQIPILPEVKYIFELILKNHYEKNYVSDFLAYDGNETILSRSLDRTLRRLCAMCNVTYFNSHSIRKTFATVLHHHNVPTRIISDLLGHSEIGTTENCYILSYDDNFEKYYDHMHNALTFSIKKSSPESGEDVLESARRGSNPSLSGGES